VGEWDNDKRHGQGTYYYISGNRYVGGWDNDNQHGQGTYTWASGSRYVGEFLNGEQTGRGTYTNPDGSPFSDDTDGDGDSDFGDFLIFVGAALGVAAAIVDATDGSSSGGSGGTVYTNPSKGTVYNNPSKKGTGGGRCSGGMMTGTCSCWNPCCLWYWADDGAGGLSRVACSSK